jgi:RimJ/RimL family protein N-acetyltransferase
MQMTSQDKFIIRSLTEGDIDLIADYWLLSEKEFLVGLGVDIDKIPSREALTQMLTHQIQLPDSEKSSLACIAAFNGIPIGHCNVNEIRYGEEAYMHLHLWNTNDRKKGMGTRMVLASLPVFFERLSLETIWSEPFAKNPGPNKTLEKIGFEFVRQYVTVPGSLSFEQEVKRWKMTKERFDKLGLSPNSKMV